MTGQQPTQGLVASSWLEERLAVPETEGERQARGVLTRRQWLGLVLGQPGHILGGHTEGQPRGIREAQDAYTAQIIESGASRAHAREVAGATAQRAIDREAGKPKGWR